LKNDAKFLQNVNFKQMTIDELIKSITQDTVAVFFFFLIIPIFAFLVGMGAKQQGNQSPYSYLFSTIIYLVTVPGVLSLTFWVYSMLYGQQSLIELPFTIYYMPLISMGLTFFLVSRHANIRRLPWFGALYELMIMMAVVFGFILLFMHLGILPLRHVWQVILVFIALFILLKLGWERFVRIMS
jgi:hypothetical protein